MDIGRSFSYITEDQDWLKKILIGGLISLIPIVGQIYVMGYVLQVLKNLIEGLETPLPEATEDFGEKLVNGLVLWVINFIYFLPLTIVGSISGGGGAILTSVIEDVDTASAIAGVWGSCFGCLSLILGILISLLIPFVWAKYAESGQFGDAFKLGDIFALLKDNLGSTIIVILVSWLVSLVAGIVGFITCIVGLIFTMFYAKLVTVFLYGSLYRQAKEKAL